MKMQNDEDVTNTGSRKSDVIKDLLVMVPFGIVGIFIFFIYVFILSQHSPLSEPFPAATTCHNFSQNYITTSPMTITFVNPTSIMVRLEDTGPTPVRHVNLSNPVPLICIEQQTLRQASLKDLKEGQRVEIEFLHKSDAIYGNLPGELWASEILILS